MRKGLKISIHSWIIQCERQRIITYKTIMTWQALHTQKNTHSLIITYLTNYHSIQSMYTGKKTYLNRLRCYVIVIAFMIACITVWIPNFYKRAHLHLNLLYKSEDKCITMKWRGYCVVLWFITLLCKYFFFCLLWILKTSTKQKKLQCCSLVYSEMVTNTQVKLQVWISSALGMNLSSWKFSYLSLH